MSVTGLKWSERWGDMYDFKCSQLYWYLFNIS